MKIDEIKQKKDNELKDLLKKIGKDIEDTTRDILQQKEKNVKKVKFMRKDIARIKTVLKERELENLNGEGKENG